MNKNRINNPPAFSYMGQDPRPIPETLLCHFSPPDTLLPGIGRNRTRAETQSLEVKETACLPLQGLQKAVPTLAHQPAGASRQHLCAWVLWRPGSEKSEVGDARPHRRGTRTMGLLSQDKWMAAEGRWGTAKCWVSGPAGCLSFAIFSVGW